MQNNLQENPIMITQRPLKRDGCSYWICGLRHLLSHYFDTEGNNSLLKKDLSTGYFQFPLIKMCGFLPQRNKIKHEHLGLGVSYALSLMAFSLWSICFVPEWSLPEEHSHWYMFSGGEETAWESHWAGEGHRLHFEGLLTYCILGNNPLFSA